MQIKLPALLTLWVVGVSAIGISYAAEESQPEFTIKEVMTKAHKQGLLKKVLGGEGSAADKEELVKLYTALAAHEPPKGDAADWKKKTASVEDAAKAVAEGKDGAIEQLKKAANCAACHKAHKPAA